MLESLLALAGGYALGSIPFAYIVTNLFGLGDIRQVGSGNVGATNVLRTGNKLAAALTLIGDVGKGVVAVLLARQFGEEPAMAAALGAFLGHIFPVWLNFKGGKGVATCLGILAALSWPVALLSFGTWLAAVAIGRISSLAALIAAVVAPIYMAFWGPWFYVAGATILAALVFLTHRDNIRRLLAGQEPRIGQKKA
ncbi:MAG: glycerol-3-phosphate 1-O-acyltransferase PlsY [Parvibaculum sp.]|uniref:glycerol-3-phosphate 1-O-acyltransferase PlsY n=1 Tax=Parvibaculum sp. TaxID=2024848 RepID=UPI0025D82C47|nr:glycerol-3-phosphate 1-O-acyltransferase PlsY [Parvibaculum sp.]MCE9648746.1 glycerol-3-phosphate 1-O-acyltransferase PlsY [Parvibaculum sp.]